MQAQKFFYPLIIKETYLDSFGHMNNATYLTIYEEARWDLLNKNGYGLEKIRSTQQGPIILEAHVRFLKELKARDEVVIETYMTAYERKIGRLTQNILKQDVICSTVEIVFGLFDIKKRVLVLPTPEWLSALGV